MRRIYSEVLNKSVTFLILFWNCFLPTWLYQDPHVYLFLGKVPIYTVFLRNKYQKIPTCMPLLRPTGLLISEKTSHLRGIRAPRLLGVQSIAPRLTFS